MDDKLDIHREVDLQGGKVLGDEWAEHVVTHRNGIMLRAKWVLLLVHVARWMLTDISLKHIAGELQKPLQAKVWMAYKTDNDVTEIRPLVGRICFLQRRCSWGHRFQANQGFHNLCNWTAYSRCDLHHPLHSP